MVGENVGLRVRGKCEQAIVDLFRIGAAGLDTPDDRIPFAPAIDTVAYEYAFKYGRADIVIFHFDGTASVIEVKDGSRGYMHVAQGIGQVGLYAAQLANPRLGLRLVRRCLLWTSTGDLSADAHLEVACEQAGVVALPWGALTTHLAVLAAGVPA
jgi:hypothetical protein